MASRLKKVVVAAMFTPLIANAGFLSFNDFLEQDRVAQLGYIMGAVDTVNTVAYCIPENATSGQLLDVVLQYAKELPKFRHWKADLFINTALKVTYPCPVKPSTADSKPPLNS